MEEHYIRKPGKMENKLYRAPMRRILQLQPETADRKPVKNRGYIISGNVRHMDIEKVRCLFFCVLKTVVRQPFHFGKRPLKKGTADPQMRKRAKM